MTLAPSHATAAAAGAWAAFGLVPVEMWMSHHKEISVVAHSLIWLFAGALFFVGPAYFLVFGADQEAFSRDWFLDSAERARYGDVAKRMFVWFVTAAVVASLWSMTLSFILPRL